MVAVIKNRILEWDVALCLKMDMLKGRKFLDHTMRLLSKIGDGALYPLFVAMIVGYRIDLAGTYLPAVVFAFAVELVIQKGIKHLLKRPRPCLTIPNLKRMTAIPDEFSFPSGHTAGAFLMAVQIAALFPTLAVPVYLLASGVALSRVYNGVHYPSDVLAGWLLGIGSGKLGIWIFY